MFNTGAWHQSSAKVSVSRVYRNYISSNFIYPIFWMNIFNTLSGKPVRYQVTVRTGDVRYAGTDANVYVIVHGSKGKTKKLFMDDARDNFERGATEVFEVSNI